MQKINSADIQRFYTVPTESSRSGVLFNAHSYPTKINSEAIVPFILLHSDPGDVVYDGFAGSGSTGLAAALSGTNDAEYRQRLEDKYGRLNWGARRSISYDLSPLSAFLGNTLLSPVDPWEFENAAGAVLRRLSEKISWVYSAKDPDGEDGEIRYTIWSEVVICPHCEKTETFWSLAVRLGPVQFLDVVECPKCHHAFPVKAALRVTTKSKDRILNRNVVQRERRPVAMYGRTGSKLWKRGILKEDLEIIARLNQISYPASVPVMPMMQNDNEKWGEMHRSGYHTGMTHVHHFYTQRNLYALACAWDETLAYPQPMRDALRYWISSYNATHSTLMTRAVAKQGSNDLVVTSAQSAALYVSSIPVEKNIISGLKAKKNIVSRALLLMRDLKPKARVRCGSSLNVGVEDNSVDYIFTDPPFGDNIQYSEINFISEAWLGQITDSKDEAIVSRYQSKDEMSYEELLTRAFAENYRILKPNRYMTVIFHSSKAAVWDAVRFAWEAAGFSLVTMSVLDKTQGSFKQVSSESSVSGDKIILLIKQTTPQISASPNADILDVWELTSRRVTEFSHAGKSKELTKQNLYRHALTYYLENRLPIPIDSKQYFEGLKNIFIEKDGAFIERKTIS
jgi:DNA modification methylase